MRNALILIVFVLVIFTIGCTDNAAMKYKGEGENWAAEFDYHKTQSSTETVFKLSYKGSDSNFSGPVSYSYTSSIGKGEASGIMLPNNKTIVDRTPGTGFAKPSKEEEIQVKVNWNNGSTESIMLKSIK
ncbi:hypothetical protein [Paenibacillus oleatilyticus]|uniref:hypothetical protein n=1 Tax=Paenibacillus oleatilyticus TaxID=2594886 RepID=UPI001C1F509E|nr:hypothetical protein [Paenibacillus oleatilyticus]MBU7314266.1 hypothetical protein [Paenibacillus oleatilyticus]